MNEYIKSLNEEQRAPVLDTEGAVLVTAGAGSGKTRVLTGRIAHLIKDKQVYPYNILAITFTNKAANEMQERLMKMIPDASELWVLTIHKMCVRILRSSGHMLGYSSRFTIYTDNERERVIKQIFKRLQYENDKIIKNVKYHIDRAKMLGQSPEEYANTCADEKYSTQIIQVYREYEIELKMANALDFDDLLIKTYELLAFKKEALDYYSRKFRYIHVDEFQDINTLQYKIIKLLTSAHGNIFAVGDDDQSIYGWRGAQVENILNFEKDFKGARLYKLERNYRSTKNILNAANYVIKNNAFRRDKRLWTDCPDGERVEFFEGRDENEEAAYAANIIRSAIARGAKPSDFAILMRLNALSRAYEQEFMRLNIPTIVYGGQKFFDRKEIKDLAAYLRIIDNPSDNDALLRIINVPRRGIGEKTVETLMRTAIEKNITLFDTLLDLEEIQLGSGALTKLKEFANLLKEFIISSQDTSVKLTELVKSIVQKTGFLTMFEAPGADNESRTQNVYEFMSSVEEFVKNQPDTTLSEYLASITLSTDSDKEPQRDCVVLATIHAVKGLEFKTVFICGLDEGILPMLRTGSDESDFEEERRLMYVAITRAKECLHLTRARSRYLYGDRKETVPSRFLNELGGVVGEGVKKYSSSYHDGYEDDFTDYVSNSRGYLKNTYGSGGHFGSSPKQGSRTVSGYGGRLVNSEQTPDFAPRTTAAGANLAGAFARTKVEAANKNVTDFSPGSKVIHTKFGEGTIIAVKGSGKSAMADIAFVDRKYGIKQLALAVAPLTVKK